MKGKVLIAGLMLLLSLSLLSCGDDSSGGAPGSTNSDKTGILITSVSIKNDTTPPPDPNIDVFSTITTGITKDDVTIIIGAERRNESGLAEPFPATVEECTITYVKADPSSPNIPSLTIFPNCILLSSTPDKPNTCTVTLIDVQRKNDYWNAINQGLNKPSEYPTHYTAQYSCKYRSSFEADGYFKVAYDIWLADFPLVSPVTVGSVAVSANPATVSSGGPSTISAYVTTNVGDPVPDNTTVTFTSTAGSLGTPFAKTTSGAATTTFTAPTVTADINVTVTASVGGKSGSASVAVTAPLTCTASAPTVSIAPSTRTVAASGSVTYTVAVTNNDTGGACTSTTFTLTKADTPATLPPADFASSTLSAITPSPCALAAGASCTATLTHTAAAAPTAGQTLATSVTAAAGGHANGVSNTVTTTIGP